jgi:hypothetical protein
MAGSFDPASATTPECKTSTRSKEISQRQTATRNAPVVERMAAFSRKNHVDLRALA